MRWGGARVGIQYTSLYVWMDGNGTCVRVCHHYVRPAAAASSAAAYGGQAPPLLKAINLLVKLAIKSTVLLNRCQALLGAWSVARERERGSLDTKRRHTSSSPCFDGWCSLRASSLLADKACVANTFTVTCVCCTCVVICQHSCMAVTIGTPH